MMCDVTYLAGSYSERQSHTFLCNHPMVIIVARSSHLNAPTWTSRFSIKIVLRRRPTHRLTQVQPNMEIVFVGYGLRIVSLHKPRRLCISNHETEVGESLSCGIWIYFGQQAQPPRCLGHPSSARGPNEPRMYYLAWKGWVCFSRWKFGVMSPSRGQPTPDLLLSGQCSLRPPLHITSRVGPYPS